MVPELRSLFGHHQIIPALREPVGFGFGKGWRKIPDLRSRLRCILFDRPKGGFFFSF
jgi:hypothetical protein